MKLLQRLKNVFTNELVDPLEQIKQLRERGLLLDQAEIDKVSEVVIPDTTQYGWSVDWDRIGTPFSVEWQKETSVEKAGTLIGYWPPEGTYNNQRCVMEWHLPTTPEQHEEVVKDFEAWLDLKEENKVGTSR